MGPLRSQILGVVISPVGLFRTGPWLTFSFIKPMKSVLIQLPTEPSYWGSSATSRDVSRICDNLEEMISSRFEEFLEIRFDRVENPTGCGVHCDCDETVETVHRWIEENWEVAL